MVGLQLTRNIEAYLQSPYVHDDRSRSDTRLVKDVIRSSLQRDNAPLPLLFPFLFVEAKKDRSDYSWEEIEIQTCFPIQEALKLQLTLANARGGGRDIVNASLVWFLANRGPDWRVYAVHIGEKEGQRRYVSMRNLKNVS